MHWSGEDYLWIIVAFFNQFGLIPTAPIHCRGSIWGAIDVMQNLSKSGQMKKQTFTS